jgi:hypothetical protein
VAHEHYTAHTLEIAHQTEDQEHEGHNVMEKHLPEVFALYVREL